VNNTGKRTDADRTVDAIMTRFPGPVALRVSRVKWLGLFGFSLAFAYLIYVIHDGSMIGPRRMTGYNAALPDTYDLSLDELARLMNQWRALALARQH
jgi:hypothetical protein